MATSLIGEQEQSGRLIIRGIRQRQREHKDEEAPYGYTKTGVPRKRKKPEDVPHRPPSRTAEKRKAENERAKAKRAKLTPQQRALDAWIDEEFTDPNDTLAPWRSPPHESVPQHLPQDNEPDPQPSQNVPDRLERNLKRTTRISKAKDVQQKAKEKAIEADSNADTEEIDQEIQWLNALAVWEKHRQSFEQVEEQLEEVIQTLQEPIAQQATQLFQKARLIFPEQKKKKRKPACGQP